METVYAARMPHTYYYVTGIDPSTCRPNETGSDMFKTLRAFWDVPVYEIQQACLKAIRHAEWALDYQWLEPSDFLSRKDSVTNHQLVQRTIVAIGHFDVVLAIELLHRYLKMANINGPSNPYAFRFSRERALAFACRLLTSPVFRGRFGEKNPFFGKASILRDVLYFGWAGKPGVNSVVRRRSSDPILFACFRVVSRKFPPNSIEVHDEGDATLLKHFITFFLKNGLGWMAPQSFVDVLTAITFVLSGLLKSWWRT